MNSTVVNVKKKELNKRNIADFKEWNELPNTLYIGRNMNFYVPGTFKSKWANPFTVKKHGVDNCIKLYEEHIRNSTLYSELHELDDKELGCWCKPNNCHGDVLINLRKEQLSSSPLSSSPSGV